MILKTTEKSGMEKSYPAKNSSLEIVHIFHNASVTEFAKICQFYFFSPDLRAFSKMMPENPAHTGNIFTLKTEQCP